MKKILVIDDDQIICELLEEALSSEYRVRTTLDSLDAMVMIVEDRPDLIISDFNMNMSQLHGVSLVEHVLEKEENQGIKFILMSGYLQPDQLKRWKELIPGALFFAKPFTIQEMKTGVNALLSDEQ